MSAFARAQALVADGYLRSAVSAQGHALSMREVEQWLVRQRIAQPMVVTRMPLRSMADWRFAGAPLRLAHRTGRFFTLEGLRVETDFGPVRQWDQPIIRQPEVGILGIITRVFGGVRHFLMQAKVEPGNLDGAQVSPTVQATRSNYTRVHGGHTTPYLEYFLDRTRARVLVDQLQGEQGSRYLGKQNRNMIVEVDEPLDHDDRFCWMTLGQIKQLLKRPNLVNMDTRTVLACLPFLGRGLRAVGDGSGSSPLVGDLPLGTFAKELLSSVSDYQRPAYSMSELLHWLTDLRASHEMRTSVRGLDELSNWVEDDLALRHESDRYFSVVAVDVTAGIREVAHWQQPLIAHEGLGLNGFVLQRVNGTLHLLVRACLYPGNRSLFELGSTVSRSNADLSFGQADAPPYLDLFADPPAHWVRYAAAQSEEGGRFYHYQNRYVILEVPESIRLDPSPIHRWMTLGQVEELVVHGYVNIEGRNLLACLDLCSGSPR